MRTTVDLPAQTYELVKHLAEEHNQSVSLTISQLTRIGLDRYPALPLKIETNPITGFPTVSASRPITSAEVADLIDEDL